MTNNSVVETMPLMATTDSLLLGGSSTFLLNLMAGFKKRGLALPVAILSHQYEHQKEVAVLQGEVGWIDSARHIYEDRLLWGYQQVARHKPRALLANLGPGSFEMLRLVPPGVLRLGIVQTDEPGPYEMIKLYAPWLDVVVGVSNEIARKMRALPECAGRRVECIPYGIHFAPQTPRETRPEDSPLRVVYVGRVIEEQKRVSRLAAVIHLCQQRRLNVEFTIIGSGPQEDVLKAEVGGLPGVKMHRSLPNYEVFAALRQQDVFILLSDYEGLPLSLLEAMGEGVVPIISDLPSGIREVVTDICGLRVPIGDVPAAVDGIACLYRDRARLNRYSQACLTQARQNYSADRMAQRYLEMIAESTPSPRPIQWPEKIKIPIPMTEVHPWKCSAVVQHLRRLAKRLRLSSHRGQGG